jgi:hypothetical protein
VSRSLINETSKKSIDFFPCPPAWNVVMKPRDTEQEDREAVSLMTLFSQPRPLLVLHKPLIVDRYLLHAA